MRPKTLGSLLDGIVEYKRFIDQLQLRTPKLTLQSVSESIPFTLANLAIDLQRPMLILTPKQDQAQEIQEQMQYWGAVNTLLFNETEALPFERVPPDLEIMSVSVSANPLPIEVIALSIPSGSVLSIK